MERFEYKVVPAPVQGKKSKGVKGTSGRFALALETLMNELGAEGWEYVRADTLPCEERSGLTGRTTTFQNMLVFRRTVDGAQDGAEEASAKVAGLLSAPLPATEGEAAWDGPAAPAAKGPGAVGSTEPPMHRAGAAPTGASEAARAAALALRTQREERRSDGTSDDGVAAE